MSQTKTKKPISQRALGSVIYDKGKRHYWNREKKDYGFYQSEQTYVPSYNYSHSDNPEEPMQRRRHSTIGTHNYDGYQLYHDSMQNNSMTQNSMQKYKRSQELKTDKKQLNLVSHNIEVKLPAINKNSNRVNTQDSEQFFNKQINTNQRDISPGRQVGEKLKQRTKTESSVHSERTRKIRFSPTYVCSFNNPLPTFKLYSGGSKPLYQYGFSEERA